MNNYHGMEIGDDCSLAPCVSCGVPIVVNFEIQQCHVCQHGLTPVLESMGYSKVVCSQTHAQPVQ